MPESLKLSVFDRLNRVEPGYDLSHTLRDSVLRDVQDLLNSRRPESPVPAARVEAANSILVYGLPDFSGMTVASRSR